MRYLNGRAFSALWIILLTQGSGVLAQSAKDTGEVKKTNVAERQPGVAEVDTTDYPEMQVGPSSRYDYKPTIERARNQLKDDFEDIVRAAKLRSKREQSKSNRPTMNVERELEVLKAAEELRKQREAKREAELRRLDRQSTLKRLEKDDAASARFEQEARKSLREQGLDDTLDNDAPYWTDF